MDLSWINAFKDTVAGGMGSLCCVYVGLPFDIVKMRLQTQYLLSAPSWGVGTAAAPLPAYHGLAHCGSTIVRQEGVLALWKGALPAVASAFTENTVLFLANRTLRRLVANGEDTKHLTVGQEYMLGGLSGIVSGTAITPAEQVKIKMQFQREQMGKAEGGMSVLLKTYRSAGLCRGVFKGWSVTLLRDVPYNLVQFGTYHNLCKLVKHVREKAHEAETRRQQQQLALASVAVEQPDKDGKKDKEDGGHGLVMLSSHGLEIFPTFSTSLWEWDTSEAERQRIDMDYIDVAHHQAEEELPLWQNFLVGGTAGVCAWMVIYPLDVLKSILQTESTARGGRGLVSEFRTVVRHDGWRGLYRGYSAALLRAFPANGALFLGVEVSLRALDYCLPPSLSAP
eukprot:g9913.t1